MLPASQGGQAGRARAVAAGRGPPECPPAEGGGQGECRGHGEGQTHTDLHQLVIVCRGGCVDCNEKVNRERNHSWESDGGTPVSLVRGLGLSKDPVWPLLSVVL